MRTSVVIACPACALGIMATVVDVPQTLTDPAFYEVDFQEHSCPTLEWDDATILLGEMRAQEAVEDLFEEP